MFVSSLSYVLVWFGLVSAVGKYLLSMSFYRYSLAIRIFPCFCKFHNCCFYVLVVYECPFNCLVLFYMSLILITVWFVSIFVACCLVFLADTFLVSSSLVRNLYDNVINYYLINRGLRCTVELCRINYVYFISRMSLIPLALCVVLFQS